MKSKKAVLSENELVLKGKLSEHEFIFRKYFRPLTVYAMKIIGNRQDAEDVVQDVFVQLWKRNAESMREDMTAYLFVAVRNGCLKKIRHQKVVDRHEKTMRPYNRIIENPHHYLMLSEIEQCVEETLQEMPERTRDIFLLSRYERKKHKEIAETLQISIKTVEAHLTKVLSILRGRLSHHLALLYFLIKLS